ALAPAEIWVDGLGDLRGVAVDADGAVHVADRSGGTVMKLNQDRSRTVVASGLDRPSGLAFDASGRLLIGGEGAHRVIRMEADGTHTTLMANIDSPRWLLVRPDGTLYVAARAPTPEDASADAEVIVRRAASGEIASLHEPLVDLQGQHATGLA